MTKAEKIQEAWGVHYGHDIDENGFRIYNEFENHHLCQWGNQYFDKGFNKITRNFYVRPKSLYGIENNNGWIKIESEDDLPKEKDFYWFSFKQNEPCEVCEFDPMEFNDNKHFKNIASHYQPIQKPEPPIY